jgi:PBP1b-binding outer membrane lipoprotein LpoB
MKTVLKILLIAITALFISGCADKYKGLKKSPCACLEQETSNV